MRLSFLHFVFFPLFLHVVQSSKAESFIDPMKHDLFLVTPKSFDALITRHRNSNGVAVLLHFKSSQDSDKKFINNIFNPAAIEGKGMARFGAIDCDEWKQFCQQNSNTKVEAPFVVVYPPNPWPPIVVEAHDQKSIVKEALKHVSDKNVQMLNETNVDAFLTSDFAVPKVLLFSDKPKPSVLFKALSNAFQDRLAFGFVPSSVTTLVNRYNIKNIPSVILLKAAAKGVGLGKPLLYTGKNTFEAFYEWLNPNAETFVRGGGFSEQAETASVSRPWIVQRVPEVTGPSHQDVCFKGSILCAILLTKGKISDAQKTMLESLDKEYSGDHVDRGARFKFMWLDIQTETNFREMLNLDSASPASLVVINPHKRLRYLMLPPDQEATESSIKALLERIVSGDARFTNIKKGKLPAFAPRDEEGRAIQQKEEL